MADTQGMAEHHASVTVNAPVHQVYGLFTHFNDFPKFMSFVKEVTYYDEQRSHWVAEVVGRHEWDAINENWVEDRQIGWRSTNGMENAGRVVFESVGRIRCVLMCSFAIIHLLAYLVTWVRIGVLVAALIRRCSKTWTILLVWSIRLPRGHLIPLPLTTFSIVAVPLRRVRLPAARMKQWMMVYLLV